MFDTGTSESTRSVLVGDSGTVPLTSGTHNESPVLSCTATSASVSTGSMGIDVSATIAESDKSLWTESSGTSLITSGVTSTVPSSGRTCSGSFVGSVSPTVQSTCSSEASVTGESGTLLGSDSVKWISRRLADLIPHCPVSCK